MPNGLGTNRSNGALWHLVCFGKHGSPKLMLSYVGSKCGRATFCFMTYYDSECCDKCTSRAKARHPASVSISTYLKDLTKTDSFCSGWMHGAQYVPCFEFKFASGDSPPAFLQQYPSLMNSKAILHKTLLQ